MGSGLERAWARSADLHRIRARRAGARTAPAARRRAHCAAARGYNAAARLDDPGGLGEPALGLLVPLERDLCARPAAPAGAGGSPILARDTLSGRLGIPPAVLLPLGSPAGCLRARHPRFVGCSGPGADRASRLRSRCGDAALPLATPAAPILQRGIDGHRGVKNGGERQRQGPVRSQAMKADDRQIGKGHAQPTG